MSEILNNLNNDYKQKKKEATAKEEKRQIKQDYKEMKQEFKHAEKIIKKNDLLESSDEFWSKIDYSSFDDCKENNSNVEDNKILKEMNEKIEASKRQFEEQKKHSDEVIRKANETIKQIEELKINSKKDIQYLFEQDSSGSFIRLVIPAEFVSSILTLKKTNDMDLRGKKNQDLTAEEVVVLKKYVYELSENNRKDYYTYKQGDLLVGNSQCDFCKYNNSNNLTKCIKYPDGKPENIINTEIKCEYLEIEEK